MEKKFCLECGKEIKTSKSGLCKSCVNKRRKGIKMKGGWKHTKKTKDIIRRIHKGKAKTLAHKNKISEAHKGKKLTEEHKRKISIGGTGLKRTEQTKKNISKGLKGKKNALGAKKSEEVKMNISNKLKGRKKSKEHIRKIVEARKRGKGYKMSEKSIEKMRKKLRGEKHWNWKGGMSNLISRIRATQKYRDWRTSVFKRDNFICQNCGDSIGGNLEAHHIDSFTDILDKNNIKTVNKALKCKEVWNVDNGQTLCKDCHKLTDSYGKNKIILNQQNRAHTPHK
jgi:hypothetical protein